MDCGGKQGAPPLSGRLMAFQSGVASRGCGICHRSPQGAGSWRASTTITSRVGALNRETSNNEHPMKLRSANHSMLGVGCSMFSPAGSWGRQHLQALDVSWGHEPGGARAARVPAALERRKEASETSEGCRQMCEPHVPRLNGAEPALSTGPTTPTSGSRRGC